MDDIAFNPFTDRLCRDIRNNLSRAFVKGLESGNLRAVQQISYSYLTDPLPPSCRGYITDRQEKYEAALEALASSSQDPIDQALVLWNLGLQFEVHEVLEAAWRRDTGKKKLVMQALIRAAGAYIKLEAGYPEPAHRMAAKAAAVLEEQGEVLRSHFDGAPLVNALRALRLPPPQLH